MTILRRFNDVGMSEFKSCLARLRVNGATSMPTDLLEDSKYTDPVDGKTVVNARVFKTKAEIAHELKSLLMPLGLPNLLKDDKLWTWLTFFYFDSVCPVSGAAATRKVNADAHYILESRNHQRFYRHLLATPFRVLEAIPVHHRLFLNADVSVHGDIIEQTISRLFLMRKASVCEALDLLYVDPKTGRAFPAVTNRKKPGNIRRLVVRVQQAQLTYDLEGMKGEHLVRVLGTEFKSWSEKVSSRK